MYGWCNQTNCLFVCLFLFCFVLFLFFVFVFVFSQNIDSEIWPIIRINSFLILLFMKYYIGSIFCTTCRSSYMRCIGMCCPNGLLFLQISLYMYSNLNKKIPKHICLSDWGQIFKYLQQKILSGRQSCWQKNTGWTHLNSGYKLIQTAWNESCCKTCCNWKPLLFRYCVYFLQYLWLCFT